MPKHKPKVKPRPKRTRQKEKWEHVCHRCKTPCSDDPLAPRSLTWAYGMAGVRFIFCSDTCRDAHDDEVRAGWITKEDDE